MIKRLLLALARVPGLGWLRRLVGEVAEEPATGEKRRPGTSTPHPGKAGSPLTRPATAAGREAGRPEAARPEKGRSEVRPEAVRPEAARPEAARPEVERPAAARAEAARTRAAAPGAPTRAQVAVAVARTPAGAGPPRDAEPAAEFRQLPRTEQRRRPTGSAPAGEGLGLAAVGPGRAFAFWEISSQAIRRARQYLSELNGREHATAVVLRVHDITRVEFDGSNARRTMEVPIGDTGDEAEALTDAGERTTLESGGTLKGSLYLDLWIDDLDAPSPSRIFCELGVRTAAGGFVAVAWSPILDLPTAEEPAREPLLRAAVIGEPDPWRPRLAPRPTVPSAAAAAATRADDSALTTTSRKSVEDSSEALEPAAPAAALASLDFPAPAPWSSPAPSSAELLRRRERGRRRGGISGISSGLLGRRRRS